MKKLFVIAMMAFGFAVNAQENGQTAKGKWLIEGNTGFGAAHTASTGFSLRNIDTPGGSVTAWNIGAEAGYFVMDDLAIKFGLGYGDDGNQDVFSYKIGAKYYISSMIPVQIDYTGASVGNVDPSYLGFQAGYAIFLGDMVSVEPGLRYNLGLGDAEDVNVFQLNVGFALHF
ncbi:MULTISPECIES: hypothetical protein [unclassified Tenacibaculum]|uniref:hypothetical protein n=1 Tax=unclassified Tenacibaculum TaxID=2635139 RepID=UPI001F2DEFC2|nr:MULTISPECIES: hypothetical protein [unclassified Tenacibaculum]MCF2875650.1 hypothetical protein [Tenacibaculum sp. Cn5-1]MCF2935726.1 hypothetical protein [Tenacibaculum sp. Cn5-34]MCG7512286.1 hypothetical protein [Tenacibaculum sp. Cn5-46]